MLTNHGLAWFQYSHVYTDNFGISYVKDLLRPKTEPILFSPRINSGCYYTCTTIDLAHQHIAVLLDIMEYHDEFEFIGWVYIRNHKTHHFVTNPIDFIQDVILVWNSLW